MKKKRKRLNSAALWTTRRAPKKLPTPSALRIQTSQRGVNFATLAEARADFEAWLDTGKSPAGAKTSVHIWQNDKERVIDKIWNDPEGRGERLREVLHRALRSGRIRIRKIGANRQ